MCNDFEVQGSQVANNRENGVFDELLECNGVDFKEAQIASNGEEDENIGRSWEDGLQFAIDQEFESKEAVTALVKRDCHRSRFDIVIVNSNRTLYVGKCRQFEKGCKWALRVAKLKNMDCFSVRTYNKEHTYSRVASSKSRVRRKGTPSLVASMLQEDYPGLLDTPTPKSLIGLVKGKLGVKVSYSTALMGKFNPGTKTCVELHDDKKFKYLFIALGACVEGFKAMRKVIIVDACHLKTGYKGVLIFATTQDPNHHHYPIAFGVVDGENNASWTWFMKMLKTVIPDDPELVFVSHRHESIGKSIEEIYPFAKHGFCIYHLSQNVKNNSKVRYKKNLVAERFRVVAQAYLEAEFLKLHAAFRGKYPEAGAYRDRSVVKGRWARCYFPGERYNIDTTNAAKGLNFVFKEDRNLSLLPLLDVTVANISEWFNTHRKESSIGLSEHKMVPFVDNELHEIIEEANLLKVYELNIQTLEYTVIGKDGLSYYVNLLEKTCSCGRFYIDIYACVHAAAATMDNKEVEIPIYGLCSEYYSMHMWALAYDKSIYHVPHKSQWIIPDEISELIAYPPDKEVKIGRNQEKRFPSGGEYRGRRNNNTAQREKRRPWLGDSSSSSSN